MRPTWVYVGRVQTPSGWERELYATPEGQYALEVGGQYVPIEEKEEQWAAREHVEILVEASGLSRRRFAEQRLARNETTLRRWKSGKVPIPRSVILWMVAQSVALAAAADVEKLDTILLQHAPHAREGQQ